MRLQASVLGVVTAALLLAPGAGAHLGAVDVHSSSSGDEPPRALCLPVCKTRTTTFGNAPPLTVVESGGNVTWTVTEGRYHSATSDVPTEDKRQLVVEAQGTIRDSCLSLLIWNTGPSNATFQINETQRNGSQLEVLQSDEPNASWTPCPEAIPVRDGSFFLSYHCNVHPRFQHAGILVVPPREADPETV